VQQGQAECKRLTGTGLGPSHGVMASQNGRNRLKLNGSWGVKVLAL
jgi:hypothetical protein